MQPQEDEVLHADGLLQLRRDQRVPAGPQLRQGQDQPCQRFEAQLFNFPFLSVGVDRCFGSLFVDPRSGSQKANMAPTNEKIQRLDIS